MSDSPETIYIRKINIENFKCFKGKFSLSLNEGINILVGNNEAGKSTIDLNMSEIQRQILAEKAWNIEVYHRGLKNVCHIEHFQCQTEEKVRGHILLFVLIPATA